MLLIGLMSGTSADGIDAALVEIEKPSDFTVKLKHFVCLPWLREIRAEILACCRHNAPIQRVTALNFLLGASFAEAALQVVEEAEVQMSEVAAIASHGQTIWHQPAPFGIGGQQVTGTLQIGEPSVIAERTGRTVISDFRTSDMALGGQGAPLVPFADYALFGSPSESRCIQNLGGIANVTYLPAGGTLNDLIAFDIGPCNLLLDEMVRLAFQNRELDEGGELAMQGEVNEKSVEMILEHDFFKLKPPKSTGREMFDSRYCSRIYHEFQTENLTGYDILATLCASIATSIGNAYRDFLPKDERLKTVILGGGGVHNQRLTLELKTRLPKLNVRTHSDFGIPDDAKEAIAFALIGYETLHNRPSNVPAATGARRLAVLGKVTRL